MLFVAGGMRSNSTKVRMYVAATMTLGESSEGIPISRYGPLYIQYMDFQRAESSKQAENSIVLQKRMVAIDEDLPLIVPLLSTRLLKGFATRPKGTCRLTLA